jgi:ABC-type antimicrobial peptide transport system permease subunit
MQVCVINETLAARAWPDQNPIGQRFRTGGSQGPWFTVVGVARDVKEMGLTEPVKGVTYYPATQGPARFTDPQTLAVRISGDVQSLIPAIRREILAVNPNQTISRVRMFSEVVDRELSERRTYTSLLGAFAGTALLLACLGIYGVTGYAVEQRTREIGVRLALGAGSRAILGMVMSATLPWALAGLAAGLLGAAAMARVMRTMLYEVRPLDPLAFTAVPALVLTVVVLATLLPALRSLRIDPLKALRTE